jgi:quinol monooxygenase YgiN
MWSISERNTRAPWATKPFDAVVNNMPDPNALALPGAFVVIAEFVIHAGRLDDFLKHAFDDARHSLSDEPGCLQFDVLQVPTVPNGVAFYEVYRSRQDFDAHLATPHVARFRRILSECVQTELPVRMLERLAPSKT